MGSRDEAVREINNVANPKELRPRQPVVEAESLDNFRYD